MKDIIKNKQTDIYSSKKLPAKLEKYKKMVDDYLDTRILPPANTLPNKLHEAMRYSVFAGGKRIRPIIAMLACDMFSGNIDDLMPYACALELVHTYSLIHDDLPAMDNDDLRRGKPTNHKVYGEAMAILAGDALLTLAFEIIAKAPKNTKVKPEIANLILEALASGAGSTGMVGGQAMDILACSLKSEEKNVSELLLYEIHKRKTAALISASAKIGAFVANASIPDVNNMEDFGTALGLLFQISDDILDYTQTSEELGKTPGKDRDKNKLTFVSLFGLESASKKLIEFQTKTKNALKSYGDKSSVLMELVDFVVTRKF